MTRLAKSLARPVVAAVRQQCGFALLRARLSSLDQAALDQALELVRTERGQYPAGRAPHSAAWLRSCIVEAGESIGRTIIDRHVAGLCSC